jgi:hypothetical protein
VLAALKPRLGVYAPNSDFLLFSLAMEQGCGSQSCWIPETKPYRKNLSEVASAEQSSLVSCLKEACFPHLRPKVQLTPELVP